MNKSERNTVHAKYKGRCAYCGKIIEIKDMQVDHIRPKRFGGRNELVNYNPSCRRCNHYKRANSLEVFREYMITLHQRIRQNYICKVAEDYRIIRIEPFDGVFYFEKSESEGE